MKKPTLQCYKCKEQILRGDLVEYATPFSTTLHKYCPKCLKEQKMRDAFSETVCYIFGVKKPGAYIWKQRDTLIKEYGYTDQTIIDTLNYIYNIKGYKPLATSICLVKPPMVEEMLQYKRQKDFKENRIVNAIIDGINNNKEELPQIKVRENMKEKKITSWDNDDFLFME